MTGSAISRACYLIIMVGFVLLLTLSPSIVTILPKLLYG